MRECKVEDVAVGQEVTNDVNLPTIIVADFSRDDRFVYLESVVGENGLYQGIGVPHGETVFVK